MMDPPNNDRKNVFQVIILSKIPPLQQLLLNNNQFCVSGLFRLQFKRKCTFASIGQFVYWMTQACGEFSLLHLAFVELLRALKALKMDQGNLYNKMMKRKCINSSVLKFTALSFVYHCTIVQCLIKRVPENQNLSLK